MGFMDKVKATIDQGSAKLDATQLRRKMDGVARDLGYRIYAERTGKSVPAAEIDGLVSAMHEVDLAIYEAEQEAAQAAQQAQQPAAAPPPAQGAPAPGPYQDPAAGQQQPPGQVAPPAQPAAPPDYTQATAPVPPPAVPPPGSPPATDTSTDPTQ